MAVRKKKAATVGRKRAPEDETKHARFVRLGTLRMTKALNYIRLVGNVAGASYEYSEAEVAAMGEALKEAVEETMDRFKPRERGERAAFVLPPGGPAA